jgi:hypothetical protein
MKPKTTVLINREATRHDVDKWMEDLFARIQLCVMHPHSVIPRDGTTNAEETMFENYALQRFPLVRKIISFNQPVAAGESHATFGVRCTTLNCRLCRFSWTFSIPQFWLF